MESANLRHQHHQLQPDQLVGSSALATPSACYGFEANTHAPWTSSTNAFCVGNSHPNFHGNLRDQSTRQKNDNSLVSSALHTSSSMVQDISSFHWGNNLSGSFTSTIQPSYDIDLAKIKEEFSSDQSFPKFTDILNGTALNSTIDDYSHFLSATSLVKNLSSSCHENRDDDQFDSNIINNNCSSSPGAAVAGRGQFSQIYPSINISNLNQSSSRISSSMGMNLRGLDYLADTHSDISPALNNNLSFFRESRSSFGLDQMQQPQRLLCGLSKEVPSLNSEMMEAKRRPGANLMERKTPQPIKKSRLDSPTSCPPLKVRKEKLGDRIAALQQLVSPFGKTDTASVLMEAIGYIKFLQNQVETLSVPYMKSYRNKSIKPAHVGLKEDGNEELKRDLRSRGLCLVPLSCMSYVTGDGGGGGFWPNFGGRT
ncbi:hypothetical protein UlMin_034202 [Ulmus minor]